MRLGRNHLTFSAALSFSILETFLSVDFIAWTLYGSSPLHSGFGSGGLTPLTVAWGIAWQGSPLFASVGWIVVGITFYRRGISKKWRNMGFDKEVFDLMVRARGGLSRFKLLNFMEEPRHRNELSEMSGLVWKEVDRQIKVLEEYGLVKVYAESGVVRMYVITAHGKELLKMINELG